MSQSGRNIKVAIGFVSALWMLGGCSSSTPAPESAAMKHTELSFNLGECQQLNPGLYKCPAIDKPICNPDYAGAQLECVRIGKKGSVYVRGESE